MKKVLIISSSFPPSIASGSQRPYRLAKYLPQFGWDPIVLTRKVAGRSLRKIRVVETDYVDVVASLKSKCGFNAEKSLHEQFGITLSGHQSCSRWKEQTIHLFKEIITFPDSLRGWYKFALKAASELLAREKVDVIISTSPSIVSHLIASKLKSHYNVPWIADFRDLWSQDSLYINKSKPRRFLERRLEVATLKNCDAITAVSEPYADRLKVLHSSLRNQVHAVTNGFDPEACEALDRNRPGKLLMTYTGSLYNGARDPSPLFMAVQKLIASGEIDKRKIEIRFVLADNAPLQATPFGLDDVVTVRRKASYAEAIEHQTSASVLLVIEGASEGIWETYPAKIFEYLAARKPILAIAPEKGVIADLLKQTKCGHTTLSPARITEIIKEWYRQVVVGRVVEFEGIEAEIQKYSIQNRAREFAVIMSSVSERRSNMSLELDRP